jgi:16S rRNA (cytosine967-C5)-methyltransferase
LTAKLSERDAALCTELVMGTLRWQGTLDFIAQQFVQRRWTSLDTEVRVALRLGVYQLRFLCSIPGRMPARAVLHETVELVKASAKRSAAGMVNAVLRKAAAPEGGVATELASMRLASMPEHEWRAVEYSHPAWLLERWSAQFGDVEAQALARANNDAPSTFLRLSLTSRSVDEVEADLRERQVEIRPGNFLKQCRRLVRGNVTRTEPYLRREIMLQDEASQMVAHLLDVRPGHRVLDLCAAPGNKTAQLAQWAGPSGLVVACDLHLHRLARLAASPDCSNTRMLALDGTQPLPFRTTFDRILVDAPCSGTGTLRRHPEIKWRLTPGDIQTLAEKQLQLLDNAAAVLAESGRMVYSTCSLEEEENRSVVEKFLATHSEFRLLPLRADADRLRSFFHPSASSILENAFLETSSARHDCDGFFGAILVKTLSSPHLR